MILSLLAAFIFQAQAAISTSSALEILSEPTMEKRELSVAEKKSESYPSLIKVAFSEEHSIPMRWKALTLAAKINPQGAKVDLDRALKSKEWFMRNAALTAVKTTQPERINEVVPTLLKDKALVVRSAAVGALYPKLEPKMRDLLWSELNASYNFRKGQSLWVRGQIVEKLAGLPEKKEYPLFGNALKGSDEKLHASAIQALETITQRKFGTTKSTVSEKRNLWIDFVNKNPKLKL